jgi:Na+-driven multidrug efflux pump
MRKKGILSSVFQTFLCRLVITVRFQDRIPASLGMMLMSIGGIIGNVFAAGFGDAVVAANGVVMRATSITFMLVFGLAQGCQPLMGYSYGAGNYKRLFETVRRAVITGSIMCICFAVTFYSFADIWIRVFIEDEAVISYGIRIMHVLSYTKPLLGLQMI